MNEQNTAYVYDDHHIKIVNAKNGQTVRILAVDGDITSEANCAGDTVSVIVEKGNSTKLYVWKLSNGQTISIRGI